MFSLAAINEVNHLVIGKSPDDVKLGLKDYFSLNVSKCGVVNLSKLNLTQTYWAICQLRAKKRTKDAEWVQ